MKSIKIEDFLISKESPCFIIAEAGVNHNGKLEMALELVRKAKEIGVDCVKFQTFTAESVITKKAPKANYQLEVTDPAESQFEMLKKLELSGDDYIKIIEECNKQNITFLSTPYNEEDADFLNKLGVSAFKIASGQIVELAFLEHVAKFGKPIILSSGMATLAEVYEAVMTIREAGNNQMAILQCTTNYPSQNEDANIRAMISMGNSLDLIYGYSDHIEENYACFAAVALGAKVIEKHFTLDRNLPGPDHKASLNVLEFGSLIEGIRKTETALGSPIKRPSLKEIQNTKGMRRSIVLNSPIKKGETITMGNMAFKRPATGIAPKRKKDLIGKKAAVDIDLDVPLKENMILWD
ncbi:N-acetylneuraminate synthase [Maribacter sp. HTCC2170]|uniref:N-acetylneuraminate synthase n=1 Tax=Maribacter sp. (strain HTCC2170 / KCCM 42371) TaxID=313603 RepID=UPI00006BD299|nr:N-acetylneuraminate synthase [Maribacter sp. HTCC2170]EAR02776.1 N-acetylneuraminate synthase [Maribacter sp. HTCC2170]